MRGALLIAGTLLAGPASAQTAPQAPASAPLAATSPSRPASAAKPPARAASAIAACPLAGEVAAPHLYGLWRAEHDGSWHAATLLLERHPEYAGSFRGTINRNGEKSRLAGDVEDGEFTLEESADGQRISATWLGDVVPDSCGREIRGTWTREGDPTQRKFVLRKVDR